MKVCGKNVFNELIASDKKINKIYIAKNFKDQTIINKVKELKINYLFVDQNKLNQMIPKNQGIIIEVNDYKYCDIVDLNSDKVLMLDHIEDPHNFGAIIRTCEAAGIKDIIIPKDRGVKVNEVVMRTSSGALNSVNIFLVNNLVNTLNYLKKNNYFCYGADMKGKSIYEVDFAQKICIIVGNEGKGLSQIIRKNCDELISIPMKGNINSLNVSVATGIILFNING